MRPPVPSLATAGLASALALACEPVAPRAPARPSPVVSRSTPAPPAPPAPVPLPAAPAEPRVSWVWVLPVDHGLRADRGGAGGFLAPRAHGSHNGIDLLAPLGTPVRAPCAGQARAGKNSSHGKWVQLVCTLPAELGLPASRSVSLFFAHLMEVTAEVGESPVGLERGAQLGRVGKTGNASSAIIAPHLHLEAILHDDPDHALGESHSGRDQSDTTAAHELDQAMRIRCLGPTGLGAKNAAAWRARRVDPFLLLACVGAEKPSFARPTGKLAEASHPWSSQYSATTFDVDSGTPAARIEHEHGP